VVLLAPEAVEVDWYQTRPEVKSVCEFDRAWLSWMSLRASDIFFSRFEFSSKEPEKKIPERTGVMILDASSYSAKHDVRFFGFVQVMKGTSFAVGA
jgi:hypothetical protein